MMSAAASLGLSLLWDTDMGLSHIDKYTYSAEEHIKVRPVYQRIRLRCTDTTSRLALCSRLAC